MRLPFFHHRRTHQLVERYACHLRRISAVAHHLLRTPQPLELAHTSADAASEWSPEAIGDEREDFPPLTILRHVIWQPLGLMPLEYPLPGNRATCYVPRSDDDPRRRRRLMYMRDLGCCANGMAFSSTPSDLVRVALAGNLESVDGALAGGMVMSLVTRRDGARSMSRSRRTLRTRTRPRWPPESRTRLQNRNAD